MIDRLVEKRGDETRIPLKTTEVALGIPEATAQTPNSAYRKALYSHYYIGKNGLSYYSAQRLLYHSSMSFQI